MITEAEANQIGIIAQRCVAAFVEHFHQAPTDAELRLLVMAAVRYVLAPDAPSTSLH